MSKREHKIDISKYIVPNAKGTMAYVAEDGTHVIDTGPWYSMPWSVYRKVVAQTLAERRRQKRAAKITRRKAA